MCRASVDLGITLTPVCSPHLSSTWEGVLLFLWAIPFTLGSCMQPEVVLQGQC